MLAASKPLTQSAYADITPVPLRGFRLTRRVERRLGRELGMPSFMKVYGWPEDKALRSQTSANVVRKIKSAIEGRARWIPRDWTSHAWILGITGRPFWRANMYYADGFEVVIFLHYTWSASTVKLLEQNMIEAFGSDPLNLNEKPGGEGMTDEPTIDRGPYFLYLVIAPLPRTRRSD